MELRLFISSTFRDLQEEREHLVKKIFPEIRALCRARGVTFTEIDLRWGITADDAQNGGVIRACLDEIDKCRPYFIGIVGSRYGWVPDASVLLAIADDGEKYAWLSEVSDSQLGITELEMMHAGLNDPLRATMDGGIHFYLRNTSGGDATGGEGAQLDALRNRIRASGLPCVDGFASVHELGEHIRRDLTAIIDRDFVVDSERNELDEIQRVHESFSASRRQSFLPSQQHLARLDQHASHPAQPLVVSGESGSGKSSLVAYWANKYAENHPDVCVVDHYVGSGGGESEHIDVIRHIMLALQREFNVQEAIPESPEALIEALPMWLGYATHPFVIVIDAVNQLIGVPRELGWLPVHVPPNVRMVVSTTPDEPLKALESRGWTSMAIKPLDVEQRKNIITQFLAQFSKSLPASLVDRIASDAKCSLPLFLRTVLEELRIFGSHEDLGAHVENYLSSKDTDDLFQRVLQRIEKDFGERITTDVMSLLFAARNGLTDDELLATTGVTRAQLSTLLIALDYQLMRRGGLCTFFHTYLRNAVEKRYAHDDADKRARHKQLAEYFSTHPFDTRRRDEEPWQWQQAGLLDQLRDCISSIPMFMMLGTEQYQYELIAYWRSVGDDADMVGGYAKPLTIWESTTTEVDELIRVLHDLGTFYITAAKFDAAIALFERVVELSLATYGPNDERTVLSYEGCGRAYLEQGSYRKAIDFFDHALVTWHAGRVEEDMVTMKCLEGLASAHYALYEYGDAQRCAQRSLELALQMYGRDHVQLIDSLTMVAGMSIAAGDTQRGVEYMEDVVKMTARLLGEEHSRTSRARMNLGAAYHNSGDASSAAAQYRLALPNCEASLGKHPLVATMYYNLGNSLMRLTQYDDARQCLETALAIQLINCGENHKDVINTRVNLATILVRTNRAREAAPQLAMLIQKKAELTGWDGPGIRKNIMTLTQSLQLSDNTDDVLFEDTTLTDPKVVFDRLLRITQSMS